TTMSGVNVGRLEIAMRNVIIPASVFETSIDVISGAFASSPVESGKLAVFVAICELPPSATAGSATNAAATTAIKTCRALKENPFRCLLLFERSSAIGGFLCRERVSSPPGSRRECRVQAVVEGVRPFEQLEVVAAVRKRTDR